MQVPRLCSYISARLTAVASQIAGEIMAPKKTLRNAAFFSVTLVTVLYILVSSAFVRCLPTIRHSNTDSTSTHLPRM
jgi:amino acid transporter